jgi:hypothetical protein
MLRHADRKGSSHLTYLTYLTHNLGFLSSVGNVSITRATFPAPDDASAML